MLYNISSLISPCFRRCCIPRTALVSCVLSLVSMHLLSLVLATYTVISRKGSRPLIMVSQRRDSPKAYAVGICVLRAVFAACCVCVLCLCCVLYKLCVCPEYKHCNDVLTPSSFFILLPSSFFLLPPSPFLQVNHQHNFPRPPQWRQTQRRRRKRP